MNTIKCPLSDYNAEEEKLDGITFWKVCDFKYGIEDKLVTEIKNQTADKKISNIFFAARVFYLA